MGTLHPLIDYTRSLYRDLAEIEKGERAVLQTVARYIREQGDDELADTIDELIATVEAQLVLMEGS